MMRAIKDPRINAFEKALLDALLAGPLEVLTKLRAQLQSASVVSRELSGAGFFLNFAVLPEVPRVEPPRIVLSDVFFELKGTEHGGGAILFVDDGAVSRLEGYSHAGGWPDELTEFTLSYLDGIRDMAKLAANIASAPHATS